ncbi:hypothetical protein GCM10010389_37330 [Streptomyces echinoruber]|uniref:Uncharacterized protein n=1 Tax=Streptomyces echinoruber TaxID=68898 RepID=A0A918VEG7_9ACTN|nr:hypothetical protein GCM10010389_37330 [Streptomyces echinoruber]
MDKRDKKDKRGRGRGRAGGQKVPRGCRGTAARGAEWCGVVRARAADHGEVWTRGMSIRSPVSGLLSSPFRGGTPLSVGCVRIDSWASARTGEPSGLRQR